MHSCIFVVHSCIFGANKKLPRKVVAKAPALLIREHRMHNVLHIWVNLVSDGLGGSSGRPRHRDSCDLAVWSADGFSSQVKHFDPHERFST